MAMAISKLKKHRIDNKKAKLEETENRFNYADFVFVISDNNLIVLQRL